VRTAIAARTTQQYYLGTPYGELFHHAFFSQTNSLLEQHQTTYAWTERSLVPGTTRPLEGYAVSFANPFRPRLKNFQETNISLLLKSS
jgi:hypothetical protein